MCRFYYCPDPRLLLRLPYRLFNLLARHVGRLQAEEDLRAAYVAALPWAKDDGGLRALRRLALGEGELGHRRAAPARSASRAEILAMAARERGIGGGGIQVRRKGTDRGKPS